MRIPISVSRLFLALGLALAAAPGPAQEQSPQMIPAERVPFFHDWAASPHAKADARAFTNWNDKGEIPETCARCHSTPGFLDYIGADGSAVGSVEQKAPTLISSQPNASQICGLPCMLRTLMESSRA